jgi:queuine/archaeosine tRNA-ribosyltransferase
VEVTKHRQKDKKLDKETVCHTNAKWVRALKDELMQAPTSVAGRLVFFF